MLSVDFTGTPLSGDEPLTVVFTSTVISTPDGGGTSSKKKYYGKLPEYYSRRTVKGFERVQLPQDPEANPIAVEVVRELANINEKLDRGSLRFSSMMQEAERLSKLVATYIEQQQITDLLQLTQMRIQAAEDARMAKEETEELEELKTLGVA